MLCGALLAVVACGDDGKNTLPDGPHLGGSDAGSDGSGPEASVATKTISGTATYHYISPNNPDEMITPDLSSAVIYGYSLENGAWVGRGGTGGAGTFSFPVDQDATSWLWSEGTAAQQSSSTSPDLTQYILGRSDVTYPMQDTETTVALTNMAPWVSGDQLELLMPNNGGVGFAIDQFPLNEPNDGDTTIDNTFDWENLDVPLMDAAQNDILYLLHLTTVNDGELSYSALTEMATASDFTMIDGQTANIAAAFDGFERDSQYALDWHGSAFEAVRAGTGADADAPTSNVVAVDALPTANEHGFYSGAPDLVLWYGDGTDTTGTLHYVDPFPFGKGHWDDFVIWQYEWQFSLPAGGSTVANFYAGYFGYDSVGNLASIAPTLTPPTALKLNGTATSGTTVVTGATTTPTFAWSAPTTGTPTDYLVVVYGSVSFSGFAFPQAAGIYHVTDTSLTLPDGALESGMTYIAIISSESTSNDPGTSPDLQPLGYLRADAVTAPFTP